MKEIIIDYSALKRRIKEAYGTINAFSDAVGMSEDAVGRRLNNKTEIEASIIKEWAKTLGIESEFERYFFTLENCR